MKELSITKKINNFHLNSVNGGHSFFSENQIEFFYCKLHPSKNAFKFIERLNQFLAASFVETESLLAKLVRDF